MRGGNVHSRVLRARRRASCVHAHKQSPRRDRTPALPLLPAPQRHRAGSSRRHASTIAHDAPGWMAQQLKPTLSLKTVRQRGLQTLTAVVRHLGRTPRSLARLSARLSGAESADDAASVGTATDSDAGDAQFWCCICRERHGTEQAWTLTDCGHSFCRDGIRQWVVTQVRVLRDPVRRRTAPRSCACGCRRRVRHRCRRGAQRIRRAPSGSASGAPGTQYPPLLAPLCPPDLRGHRVPHVHPRAR